MHQLLIIKLISLNQSKIQTITYCQNNIIYTLLKMQIDSENNVSNQNQSSPSKNSLQSVYRQELFIWIKKELEFILSQHQHKRSLINTQYFHKAFLNKVQMYTKLELLVDNSVADIIKELMDCQIQFQVWDNNSKINHGTDTSQAQAEILFQISRFLFSQRYINKRKFSLIKVSFESRKFLESRILDFLSEYKIKKANSFGKDFYQFIIKIWKKTVYVNFQGFWSNYIFVIANFPEKDILKQLFSICQSILCKILHQDIYQRLHQFLATDNNFMFNDSSEVQEISLIEIQPIKKSQIIQQFIIQDNLFHPINSNILSLFESKFEQVKYLILNHLNNDYNPRIESYGSFKSKFCLITSDIDMTVFYDYPAMNQRQSAIRVLKKIENILRTNLSNKSIKGIYHPSIKVPLLTVQFDDEQYLKSIDIVANNSHGVQNSELLYKFSKNQTIQNFGILLKKWAKNEDLIAKHRLSSYGVLLMMIYYLMSTNKIQFLQSAELSEKYDCSINENFDYLNQFLGFLQFYSEQNSFFAQSEVICLFKNCYNHDHIVKDNFLINIHDPYDGTNPGRFKKRDQNDFFDKVEMTHKKLMSLKTQTDNSIIKYRFSLILNSKQ